MTKILVTGHKGVMGSHLIKKLTNCEIITDSINGKRVNLQNNEEVMKIVAFRFCPLDAHKSIKSIAHNVLNKKGGDGVIRELLDLKEKFLIK